MHSLFVLSLLVYSVACETHSLSFLISTTSVPVPGQPTFFIVGCLDQMGLGNYSSETRKAHPFNKSIEDEIGPEHWKELTNLGQLAEINYRGLISWLENRFVQKADIHVLQVKFECELHDDNTKNGGIAVAYDGELIIIFDKERSKYIPATQEAQFLTQHWNGDPGKTAFDKALIELSCIKWLKIYLSIGKKELEKKVQPNVNISCQQLDSGIKLYCHVYRFYPKDVNVKWMKNDEDEVYSREAKLILPNPDWSYQITVTVEVIPKQGDNYSCYVDHSSLNKTMIITWEPSSTSRTRIVIGIIIAVLFVLALSVVGKFIYKRISGQHQII